MIKVTILTLFCSILAGSQIEELKVVIERNVPVPMRDGTILRADVHRPDRGGPYPVLVNRTPYAKKGNFVQFVKAGYIIVFQDVRGRYESEGKWESFYRSQTQHTEDGYDTVEWAAKLPGSNGKVGTFGSSNPASLQWGLAPLCPPSLVAMSAWSIPAQIWYGEKPCTIRPGFRLQSFVVAAADMRRRENIPGVHTVWEARELWGIDFEKWLNWLTWLELPDDFYGHETGVVKSWLSDPHHDPWKLHEGCRNILVPNLDVVGWYDHANGDMLLFRTMVKEAKTEVARKGSRIIIGPWNHGFYGRHLGEIDFGPNAVLDRMNVQIRWFDYWLKGKQNGVDKDAPVRIFVMGDNKWRDEQCWPLQRIEEKVMYITSEGNANTPRGDGRLIDGRPEYLVTDKYVYDPKNPVPTPYGARRPMPTDQRPLANRQDILVYETAPLTERIEVTGNPVVELYAASSAPDTDWFVRLSDVAPDGLVRDVSNGMVRARYRYGFEKPELIKPDKVIKYIIRMDPTSNAFLPGHRIRLDITSSDFPNYDRNHNTAANQNADATLVVANQTIYHGGEETTRIILPWVPNPIEEEKGEPEPEKQIYHLHQAAADGDLEQIRQFLSKKADVNSEDAEQRVPLYYAVEAGNLEVVQLLVEAEADVNAGSSLPLSVAVDKDDAATAEYLLAHGADVDAPAHWTPLQRVSYSGSVEMAELLIAKGADVNAGPWTALHGAVEEGRRDIAELLIQKGADINIKYYGVTLFQWALIADGEGMGEFLLANGADFTLEDKNGLAGLHYAAAFGHHDIVERLLAKGAKVNERDDVYEFTALHYAARFGNKNVAEVLIANDADINAKDKWDYQPIHWAAYHDRADVVELLISKGADVNAKTSLEQTPIQLAQERRNTKTVELLRK